MDLIIGPFVVYRGLKSEGVGYMKRSLILNTILVFMISSFAFADYTEAFRDMNAIYLYVTVNDGQKSESIPQERIDEIKSMVEDYAFTELRTKLPRTVFISKKDADIGKCNASLKIQVNYGEMPKGCVGNIAVTIYRYVMLYPSKKNYKPFINYIYWESKPYSLISSDIQFTGDENNRAIKNAVQDMLTKFLSDYFEARPNL